ncbi:unnamed protein product [Rhodiola kirilowii]
MRFLFSVSARSFLLLLSLLVRFLLIGKVDFSSSHKPPPSKSTPVHAVNRFLIVAQATSVQIDSVSIENSSGASQVDVSGGRKAVVIHVKLVRELEKTFSGWACIAGRNKLVDFIGLRHLKARCSTKCLTEVQ